MAASASSLVEYKLKQEVSVVAICLSALEDSRRPFTNAHALAETFATLTGFYKVPTEAAAELTLSLGNSVQVEALALADYQTAIGEARRVGNRVRNLFRLV